MGAVAHRLALVADRLATLPDDRFNIRYVYSRDRRPDDHPSASDCGSAACIAGWTNHVALESQGFCPRGSGLDSAQRWLGLSTAAAFLLFAPLGYQAPDAQERYTRVRAVAVLRDLASQVEREPDVYPVVRWEMFDASGEIVL